jgi:hypothetical protein
MAIVIIDGFDHYPTAADEYIGFQEVEGYNFTHERLGMNIFPSDRFGNQGKMFASAGPSNLRITNETAWATGRIVVSFAIKFQNVVDPFVGTNAGSTPFINLYGTSSKKQIYLERDNVTGELHLKNGSGTILQTSVNLLQADTWYWIEIKAFIDNAGTVEVQVDGSSTDWIDFTGDTLVYSTAALINMVQIRGDNQVYNYYFTYFDDLVIQDDDPTNTWLGDSRVTTLFPRTDNVVELATYPSTGDDNAQFLNDEGLDGPTEDDYYVWSTTAGDEDYYNFDTIDNDDAIHAVSLYYRARKTNTYPRTVQSLVGANLQEGPIRELSSSYITYHDIFEYQDPTGGSEVAWDQTNLDASTFGVRVVT